MLAIETSCDESSAAVVEADWADLPSGPITRLRARSVATFSQIALHQPYGGVVPEIASRNHLESLPLMIRRALDEAGVAAADLDAVAVTNRPGLVGALLVGVASAKAWAYALGKPLVPVHHLEGHAMSLFLGREGGTTGLEWPMAVAIVSGGHTNLYVFREPPERWEAGVLARAAVGRSRDDAAGEAFDKTAKLLGLPYPGGAWIDRESAGGDPAAFAFPRALLTRNDGLEFSFSGLKTAVSLEVRRLGDAGMRARRADLCASIQAAIIDVLLAKLELCVRRHGCRSVGLVGGVAANRALRARLEAAWPRWGLAGAPVFPELRYCTDNAAMIGAAGLLRLGQGRALAGEELLGVNAHPYAAE